MIKGYFVNICGYFNDNYNKPLILKGDTLVPKWLQQGNMLCTLSAPLYTGTPPCPRFPCRGHLWVRGLGPAVVLKSRDMQKVRAREPMLHLAPLLLLFSSITTRLTSTLLGLCKCMFRIDEIADAFIDRCNKWGASTDLPDIYSKPNNFRHLIIDSTSKHFVRRSAGFSFPHTLDTMKSPLFTRC